MNKKYFIFGVVSILILSIGVSVAYFTGNVSGNDSNIKIASKEVKIIFTDDTLISENNIELGWSTSKNFSVENQSNDIFTYKIVIKDLINTFVSDGLQYKITSSNGYSMSDYAVVPKSDSAQDVILASDIDIEVDELQEYTIEFRYVDLDEDQSEDMYKIFEGTLAIVEDVYNPDKKFAVTLNVDNGTVITNPLEATRNGSVTFDINLPEEYALNSDVVCDGGATGRVENNQVIVSGVKRNQTCTVTSKIKQYTLTMSVSNGSTSPTNVVVNHGSSKEFTISANTNYTTTGMTVSCKNASGAVASSSTSISGSKVTVSGIKEDQTCTVTLKALPKVTLVVNNGSGGTSKYVNIPGGSVSFTGISANTGYTLPTSVTCNGGASATISGSTVTVSNVSTSQTCTVTSTRNTYTVSVSSDNTSYGTVSQSATSVYYNGSITVTLTPKDGYQYSSNTCGGSVSGNTMTISGITSNKSCIVYFSQIPSGTVYITNTGGSYYCVTPSSRKRVYSSNETYQFSYKVCNNPSEGPYKINCSCDSSAATCSYRDHTIYIAISGLSISSNVTCEVSSNTN